VGDRGWILGNDLKLAVLDTQKKRKTFLHRVAIPAGQSAHIKTGTNFQLTVEASRRQLIARNHSLTHLLHAALYEILGEHIRQAGSYLDDQRLPFDFTHHATITSLQLRAIEKSLHEKIWSNLPLEVREMAYPEAIKLGAKAFFQEKYGDLVRVVKFGDLSTELCGGTHVPFTGEIGICRITAEHSVAAKTRRIELTSGLLALDQLQNELWRLKTMAETLKVSESDIESRLGTLLEEQKQLKLKLKESSQKEIGSVVDTIVAEASSLPHRFANFVFAQTSVDDLRLCADQVLEKIPSGIVALAGEAEGRALLVVKVTKDLTKKFSAAELVKACAAIIGGGGGGRPDMAQAGGSNPAQLKEAIEKIRQIVSN
jgi:alanyl-tRNA synthetase